MRDAITTLYDALAQIVTVHRDLWSCTDDEVISAVEQLLDTAKEEARHD